MNEKWGVFGFSIGCKRNEIKQVILVTIQGGLKERVGSHATILSCAVKFLGVLKVHSLSFDVCSLS